MTGEELYTTQLQAGLGLVHETRALLDIWMPGMGRSDIYQAALNSGQFPNVSARRLRNVVSECFAPRYLINDARPARFLKQLSLTLPMSDLKQLFFLYSCRANRILADFVREVYWERYAAGSDRVSNDNAKTFIGRAIDDGKTVKRWSDSTVTRISSYLTGACADYGLLGTRTNAGRKIVPYRVENSVAAYLAHDLHFKGLGDNAVVSHEDWQLFGLENGDVRDQLKKLSLKSHLIFQSAGEIAHVGWKYKSMEEFVDVLAQG